VVNRINESFCFSHPYVSLRGVLQAAHRRATDLQQEALECVFRGADGKPLLQ
jgi:hypothetical protein